MPLVICTSIDGGEEIFRGRPATVELPNAVYLPKGQDGVSWGIYDHSGRFVPTAASFSGPRDIRHLNQATLRYDEVSATAPDDVYIYGGPIHGHYGHFLLSTLSRYWFCLDGDISRVKILCHPMENLDTLFTKEFVRVIFEACGLRRDQFVSFDAPTRINNLKVYGPAFEENGYCYDMFSTLCRSIARKILEGSAEEVNPRPVYLSKTLLESGVGRIVNEEAFSRRLADAGFDIVHPEKLSFRQQLQLFRNRQQITALTGSGLHTSIFSTKRSIVGMSYINTLYTNYSMIDIVANHKSIYAHPQGEIELLPRTIEFQLNYRLTDVDRTADQFIRLSEIERSGLGSGNIAVGKPTRQSSYTIIEGLKPHATRSRSATSGRLTGRYQCHTHHEAQPWWEVDLGDLYNIKKVVLHNRSDNSQDRLKLFSIKFAKQADTFDQVFDQTASFGNGIEGGELLITFDPRPIARYVRVQLPGVEFLHLDQVEVFGELLDPDRVSQDRIGPRFRIGT